MSAPTCRCGREVSTRGELCSRCFGHTVAGHIAEALTLGRAGRQIRIVVTTPLGTRVFSRPERRRRD